jgi:tRNA 2-thiouridine synthesizing protein A
MNRTGEPGERPEVEWDAGAMGCGELVLELKLRLQALPPGALLLLTASDPGAPQDLPAWCAMTGHRLVRAEHPRYWIRRKEK